MNLASYRACSRPSGFATTDPNAPQSRVAQRSFDSAPVLSRATIGMFWLVLSVLLVACVASVANGQDYRQLPFAQAYQLVGQESDDPVAFKKRNKVALSAIKNGSRAATDALASGNAEPATTFFNEYILPSMTRTDSKSLSTIGERREEFIDDFLSSKVTGGARAAFLKTVTESMQNLAAANDFHPSARTNAVYVLGLLDRQAAGRDTAAVPAADAFSSLVNIFSSGQSASSLKAAAAAGIDRNLQMALAGNASALNDGDISKASNQALSIVNGTANGQDKWGEDFDYWMKKRSTKILGLLGNAGNNGEVVQGLTKMLQFENPKHLLLSYEAMVAVGKIDMTAVDATLASQASVSVTQFLSAALEAHADKTQMALDSLIYQNILLEDLDLTIKGNDYSEQNLTSYREAITRSNSPRPTASGRGSRDAGRDSDEDEYSDEYSDEYDSEEGSGGGFGAPAGGGSATKRRPGAPKVEVPTYQLNRMRNMIKALAYVGKRTLAEGPRNLQSVGNEQDKAMISDVVAELNILIEESDVGIVDVNNPEEDNFDVDPEVDPPGNTEQMIDLCTQASSRLAEIVRENAPGAEGANGGGAAASGDQPNF